MKEAIVTLLKGLVLASCCVTLTFGADSTEISASARKKGTQQAPELIKSSGIHCSLTDARLVESGRRTSSFAGSTVDISSGGTTTSASSSSSSSSSGVGRTSSTQYELACSEGLGYMITVVGKTTEAINCLELADTVNAAPGGGGMGAGAPPSQTQAQAQAQCILPGNANPGLAMLPYVVKSGLACTVAKARGIGRTANNTLFEVACDDNTGYLLLTSRIPDANQEVQAVACGELPENSKIQCTLTDPKAALQVADQLMAQSGKACTVKDRRLFGSNDVGEKFYEVSCNEGTGYVVQQKSDGAFGQAITCAEIGTMAGGCKLSGVAP